MALFVFSFTNILAQSGGGESAFVSILKILAPALIAGLITVATLIISRRYQNKDKSVEGVTQNYKVDVEQILKQREFLIEENQNLWQSLKAELEACRKDRVDMERIIEELKQEMASIKLELQAWNLGLKVPEGYKLTKNAGE